VIHPGTLGCGIAAAIIYTIGVLLLKRSTEFRPGPWRTTLLCNWMAAVVFAPMWWWGEPLIHYSLLWQPFLVALFFVIGQTFVVLAVTQGDVSVATPILGLKILFVTLILLLFAGQVPTVWIWPASILAILAVACLSYQGGNGLSRPADDTTRFWGGRIGLTAFLSLIAAVAYAIFDSMIQVWAETFSAATFLPIVMVFGAIISLAMIPKLEGSFTAIDRAAWPWLLGGSALTGLQSVFLTYAIGTWGQAAQANVVYSSRGLWSVIAVATVGHLFSRTEFEAPRSVKTMRLVGAVLITLAIAMLL
jgi:drug/metabolite transporter (DMT)-like permease